MTLYLLYGFSRALEFGVEVPQDMVVRAWGYMHRHYLDEVVARGWQGRLLLGAGDLPQLRRLGLSGGMDAAASCLAASETPQPGRRRHHLCAAAARICEAYGVPDPDAAGLVRWWEGRVRWEDPEILGPSP